ncbi:hypothetical protein JQK88_10420 [Mesorhizobium caraganae]|uniref:hypothetical protein n=1 Tax=Mesorhizobium caraganae TaxID=483206 RepID=UPI001939F614|nr:hypothetical protein [Mesorhizobium caraganae]MBM2711660.1 hypothetical protein [Mesorhizobium caraganae]
MFWLERLMPWAFMIEHLPSNALVDGLATVRAGVKVVSLVDLLGAVSFAGDKRAKV